MIIRQFQIWVAWSGLAISGAVAAEVDGERREFEAPGGLTEACVAIRHAPDGKYTEADAAVERALCAIDFYSGSTALCPKTFSTSPGTLVYDLSSRTYAGRANDFEKDHCRKQRIIKRDVSGDPVAYKMTMNGPETSATFAPAALLYYHFSRYFGTYVDVPVSVWRSMDRQAHYERVVQTGLDVAANGGSPMNRAGWETLAQGARDPATYRPMRELYTDEGRQIFGILLRSDGRRYDAEINGTRRSGWGAGQNRDFQKTAPFLALRDERALSPAIAAGIATAKQDPDLVKTMGADPTSVQMVFWMTELSEIVLLDFIFSQQDRVGNIDYADYWYWIEDAEVKRARAQSAEPPADAVRFGPQKIRRSIINDNDAGGRIPYANFAKTTGMVANLRHFRADTYAHLQQLVRDFEQKGPHYNWLRSSFGISERQVAQIVKNTVEAGRILRESCAAGRLRFSLDPHAVLLDSSPAESNVPCNGT